MKPDFRLFLKGMLMGAADIVPGVSGGTIAFITGIYERLIRAISGFLPAFILLLKERQWGVFCEQSDLRFLLTLMAGIFTSILLFAKLISWLLVAYPIPLWSAFFGLIVASVVLVQRYVRQHRAIYVLPLIVGVVLAWMLTSMSPSNLQPTPFNAFLSGALAICAMILPGISGSFILVMLGSYAFVLEAILGLQVDILGLFALGCLLGLLSFSNVLKWAFARFHDVTLMFLTGVMIGALNKVWPWREVVSERLNRHGESVPLLERNVSPVYYEQVTGNDGMALAAFVCAVAAAGLVLVLDRRAR